MNLPPMEILLKAKRYLKEYIKMAKVTKQGVI